MNKNQIILSSLALDLRRVAQGYYRGSDKVAERFFAEALKRKNEANYVLLKPYLKDLLNKIEDIRNLDDKRLKAEMALMYSTLLQNASIV